MSGTSKVSDMVRGASMFSNFVSALSEELVAAGGQPWMVYFCQKEQSRPLMKLLAKAIVESNLWRIPVSVIHGEIKNHRDNCSSDEETNIAIYWYNYSDTANSLTTLRFVSASFFRQTGAADVTIGIPEEIRDQLGDEWHDCGTVVTYEGQPYAITLFEKDEAIYLAPDCFDLGQ